jgi:hypothetical protein
MTDVSEDKVKVPRIRCKVCGVRFPDVNVPQTNLDAELSAHMVTHYRDYISRLKAVIYQMQRREHDPLIELATQELDVRYGGLGVGRQ